MNDNYTNKQIAGALLVLRPESEWTLRGDDYNNIDWLDKNLSKPSMPEIIGQIDNQLSSAEATAIATTAAKAALLARLGITADEAKLLIG